MFTTDGSTLCATTTIGVRRSALTVAGIVLVVGTTGRRVCAGCDSAAGLQAMLRAKRRRAVRSFMRGRLCTLRAPVHLKIIYNPTAGRGRARRNVRTIEE